MSVPLVLYHSPCQDGFTAAWAVWKKHPDWEFYPAKHGDPPPEVKDRDVYFVDFSYKRPVILDLARQAKQIWIYDHHKTAEADLVDLPPNVFVQFDLDKSGARMAWEAFHPGEMIPIIVKRVEDRDLWKFQYSDTKKISSWLFAEEYDFNKWDFCANLLEQESTKKEAEAGGEAILKKASKDTTELLQNKFRMIIGGYEVWAANLPYTFSSDAGHILAQDGLFGATFYLDGMYAYFSLRSTDNGIDVSEIAKQYGGGGHKHAAGFKIEFPVRPV